MTNLNIGEVVDAEDDDAHDIFLKNISGSKKKSKLRHSLTGSATVCSGNTDSLSIGDLLSSLKDTPTLNKVKTKLVVSKKRSKVLDRPLHRLANDRVHRGAAYENAKKQVNKWQAVVHENRLTDQRFPLNQVVCRDRTVAEAVEQFTPRTSLEKKTAEILKNSRHNLSNDVELTLSEKAALKAMSLQEAQQRRQELQKMRALLSYQEAKLKRQKKIKSKGYHRILKKQKRKQMMKDFEQLQEKDPEAAAERLDMLRKDRAQERMTLKHRSGNRWSKEIMRHAKRDPVVRKMIEEQMKLGRELRTKVPEDVSAESSDEETAGGDAGLPLGRGGRDRDFAQDDEGLLELDPKNPWITAGLAKIRTEAVVKSKPVDSAQFAELKNADNATRGILPKEGSAMSSTESSAQKSLTEKPDAIISNSDESTPNISAKNGVNPAADMDDDDNTFVIGSGEIDEVDREHRNNDKGIRSRKRKSRRSRKTSNAKVDKLNQSASNSQTDSGVIEGVGSGERTNDAALSLKRKQLANLNIDDILPSSSSSDEDKEVADRLTKINSKSKKLKRKRTSTKHPSKTAMPAASEKSDPTAGQPTTKDVISGNPSSALTIPHLPSLVMESMEEVVDVDDGQAALVAEAFADDDIVEEFEKEKKEVAERDLPKDLDLNLPGWGSWAGAGMPENSRKKQRFIVKAPPGPPRKDRFQPGLIISESANPAARKLQVDQLPFPFKSVSEFERSLRHPLGPDWNPPSAFSSLVAPGLVKKRGAVIKPIHKDVLKSSGDGGGDFGGNNFEGIF